MRTAKFKIGDKVRVLRAAKPKEHDLWFDSWMPSMNCAIGKTMTIKYVVLYETTRNDNVYPKYLFEEISLNFPEFVLENEIQVGQQLLFEFMYKE